MSNTFYIETYGCASNKADSNIISNVLIESNYKKATLENACFIIINTCGVKQPTENKIKSRLNFLYNKFRNDKVKHIVITGCLPFIDVSYIDVIRKIVPNFSAIIDLNSIHEIPLILEQIKKGTKNIIIKSEQSIEKPRFLINHPPGKITGIIPISEGCLGNCTYCCVKNARGKLNCYNPDSIITNINHQLKQGIKQIYLTSQDCSTYLYLDVTLAELVRKIVNLEYNFFLRIGMLNPKFLVENVNQLVDIFNHKKVYHFLHIPIQSGSNNILKKMNRPYKIAEIKPPIELLKYNYPNLTISTDIICGFPGETENDFQETIDLIKWLKPEILNISKFTMRPGTKAKTMKQLNSKIIKNRSTMLADIFEKSLIDLNQNWNNWKGKVLILHKGEKKNQVFGRNFAYKNIFIDNFQGNLGDFLQVKIEKVIGFNLFGKRVV